MNPSTITERIDNITRVPPEYCHAKPPAPKSVKIEISPRCNYRCGFCALRTREVQPKWDMDFGLFKRITREMREAGVEEIGAFYRKLLAELPGAEWALSAEVYSGNVLYIDWSCKSDKHTVTDGVDTFVFEGGIITAQTARCTLKLNKLRALSAGK